MSGEERSPKRQRLGSYSPASPPITADPKSHSEAQPNTPPPSVRMSPSWSQQSHSLPGLGTQDPPPLNTTSSQSFQSQAISTSGNSILENEQQTQTPATTVEDNEPGEPLGNESEDVSMEDTDNRRSDHERNEEDASTGGAKGVLYKLSTDPIPPSSPAPSADLISLYSLNNLQQSVARRDPLTGAKINILRKSYTSKVKDLGLEGKNKATKNEHELIGLVDPAWSMVVSEGKTIWQLEREEALLGEHDMDKMFGLLDSALGGMKAGHLPKQEHEHWKNLLGLEETSVATQGGLKQLPQASKPGVHNPAFLTKTTTPGRGSAPASPQNGRVAARPERAGKKRSYHDHSFEGYEEDGYDTGEGEQRNSGGGKRQKMGVAGVGMGSGVGVRSS